MLASLALAGAALAGTIEIGVAFNGQQVPLKVGDALRVKLAGNATTGYAWKVKSLGGPVLRATGVRYVPSPHPPGVVGSGGTYFVSFKAVAKGKALLKLVYVGPGTNAPTARTFSVTAVVS